MKYKSFFFVFLLGIALFWAACGGRDYLYGDYEVEYLPTYPISGDWRVKQVTLSSTGQDSIIAANYSKLYISNTAFNTKDTIWVELDLFKAKVFAAVSAKTFGSESVKNWNAYDNIKRDSVISAAGDSIVSVQNGKILNLVPKGPFGKDDSIYFEVKISAKKNNAVFFKNYKFYGHRYNGYN